MSAEKLEKIDKNFIVDTKIDKPDIKFYDVKYSPFKVYGLIYEDNIFRRMPAKVAECVSSAVKYLNDNSAGGRIRFQTDSPYIAIVTKQPKMDRNFMSHMSRVGSDGFDIYVTKNGGQHFVNSFIPPFDAINGFEKVIDVKKGHMIDLKDENVYEYTINMPLYCSVSEIYIGLSKNAKVLEPTPYKYEKPIVYYGSSITQGACASRPGNCYENIVARKIDADYINLGFSGSARGEAEMAEYIANLDMSAFVYDYDYNAENLEDLRNTHERMFKIIREKNPLLPIIIMPMPKYNPIGWIEARKKVVKQTYDNAVRSGDKNVYYIDSKTLMALAEDNGITDNAHPNDWGFYSMAVALIDVLGKIFN